MDQAYYDTISAMEKSGVDFDYVQGWVGGYLSNPMREEQRLNEAYEAGYEDGSNQVTDNYEEWVKG